MYWCCFEQLGGEGNSAKATTGRTPLLDFVNQSLWPEGTITLPATFGDLPREKLVDFLVIKAPSPYKSIVGRLAIRQLRAIFSTIHLAMKFKTPNKIVTVYGDQQVARECYRIALQKAVGEGHLGASDKEE